jgi:cation diffusion facilitator family transporter
MIAILIGYEALSRLFDPVPIRFSEAIPIACLGLAANVASAWLLSAGGHHHDHGHGHSHGHDHSHAHDHDERREITTETGVVVLDIFEDGVPPRFRLEAKTGPAVMARSVSVETVRPDGTRQLFAMEDQGGYLESVDEIPEPHSFSATVRVDGRDYPVTFEEHEHVQGTATRDNNMRAAVIYVAADAAVSVVVIIGLLLARTFGWLWMDPLAGIVGACVIASWSYGLVRDTAAILLDMNPDRSMAARLRQTVEADGGQLADLHLWRLGPGHLGAIVSVVTKKERAAEYYRSLLSRFPSLSHLTVEVSIRPEGASREVVGCGNVRRMPTHDPLS